jgi:hypothetical protein
MGQSLQEVLEDIPDVVKAWEQPPKGTQLTYPCIVYMRDLSANEFANNKLYKHMKRWQVTVIDPNPRSGIPDVVENLPYCTFSRKFVSENLNHTVFNLYF